MMGRRLGAVIFAVAAILAVSGCASDSTGLSPGFNQHLSTIVSPYAFNLAGWEIGSLFAGIKRSTIDREPASALTAPAVLKYFADVSQVNALQGQLQAAAAGRNQGELRSDQTRLNSLDNDLNGLKLIAEQTIADQIAATLAAQGIDNPFGVSWFKINFPPVNFRLEDPLNELIISPRSKIERIKSVTLRPDMTVAQMDTVESALYALNVSALVVQIGGLGATYPAFVANNADLLWTLQTASHEWVHQYLAFKPLGFHYVLDLLGITTNYSIDTINETVADLIGHEIGTEVYDRYYVPYLPPSPVNPGPTSPAGFDANAALRQIRRQVDTLLAAGHVDAAETYMNQQRDYLASRGYYIRKLNQAYFAFYGTYADSPTSVDPTGAEIRTLRARSPSLRIFLDQVSGLTSVQQLNTLLSLPTTGH